MRWIKVILASFFIGIFSVSIIFAQPTECSTIVAEVLVTINDMCADTGRNQVCYGNLALTAQGRNDTFRLEDIGDIANLADMESLSLSPYNEDDGVWGVALMQLQANLPDTLPGQNVTMLAFGDVALRNAISPSIDITAILTSNGRTRATPTTANGDRNILTAIPNGTAVTVLGRNQTGDWLLIDLPTPSTNGARFGWISTQVLRITGDRMALTVFADEVATNPQASIVTTGAPMSAFYLKTGIGQTNCAEMPPDGVLIQTPQGSRRVQMTVNGVKMSFGSTIFMKTIDNLLAVIVVEGTAIITANGTTQFIPAGAESFIPMNDDFTAPIDVPSAPIPYKIEDVLYLPIMPHNVQLVPETVTLIEPLTTDEIETAIIETFAPYGGIDGVYEFRLSQNIIHNTGGNADISFGAEPYTQTFRFSEQGIIIDDFETSVVQRIAPDMWGDPEEKHQSLRVLGPRGTSDYATTYRTIGFGVIEVKFSMMLNDNRAVGASTGIYIATWITPLDD